MKPNHISTKRKAATLHTLNGPVMTSKEQLVNQPQSMIIWEGIELIGCPHGTGNKRCGVVQGVVYHVTRIAKSKVYIEMNPEYQKITRMKKKKVAMKKRLHPFKSKKLKK